MSRSFVRTLLTALALCGASLCSSASAQTSPAASADARLRALYTEEWNWRRRELARTAGQPARPLYTLAALTLHECTPGHSFQASSPAGAAGSRPA